MMRRRQWMLGLAAGAAGAAGDLARAHAEAPLRVVASFSILADLVRALGGDAVQVTALVGPDADAHVFEPTPADAQRLARAQLAVVNGLHFEPWFERLLRAAGYRGPVAVASRGIAPRLLEGQPDPHAWQSLRHARRYVENLRDALQAARPAEAASFQRRAQDYLQRLDALDRRVRERLGRIPPANRRVVTSHDAFGYFGDEYGVVFLSAQGWTTESEASAAAVARLVRELRAQKASALFLENITDPRLVQRIAHEAGVRVGGTLYSDALSPPGTEGDTYLKLIAHNAEAIAGALTPSSATSP